MIQINFKKIFLFIAGVFLVICGLIGLLFPIIPGFVLIFVGILMLARMSGEMREQAVKDRALRFINQLKSKLLNIKIFLQKIAAMIF